MEDFYIKLLREAKEDFFFGKMMDYQHFDKRCTEKNIPVHGTMRMNLFKEIYGHVDFANWPNSQAVDRFITLDAYSILIDHDNLNEAQEQAQKADKRAIQAIWIAIVTLIITGLIGIGEIVSNFIAAGIL